MVFEKIRAMLCDQLDLSEDQVTPESSIVDDLGADSLDLVELIMAMEENFGVEIADSELEKIRTIQDAVDFLKSKGIQ